VQAHDGAADATAYAPRTSGKQGVPGRTPCFSYRLEPAATRSSRDFCDQAKARAAPVCLPAPRSFVQRGPGPLTSAYRPEAPLLPRGTRGAAVDDPRAGRGAGRGPRLRQRLKQARDRRVGNADRNDRGWRSTARAELLGSYTASLTKADTASSKAPELQGQDQWR
jgi:hypothetical protein